MNVFIWGTGMAAREVSLALHQNVKLLGYVDNNKENQGQLCLGKQVFSPEILHRKSFNYIIIGAYARYKEISCQIEKMGIDTDKIIQFFNYTKLMPQAFFYNEKYINEDLYQNVFRNYVETRIQA